MTLRLNLLLDDPAGVRPGYVNVDPLAPAGDPLRVACDPADLTPVADAGEAAELAAMDVLDYNTLPRAYAMLGHWASRLAHGGTLSVSCTDVMEVSKSLQNRLITVEQANALLHGDQTKAWRFRQCCLSVSRLADAAAAVGLVVLRKRVSEFRAVVVARRP